MKKTKKVKPRLFLKFILIVIAYSLSISAPSIHTAYIMNKTARNTVLIKSPPGAKLDGMATGFEIIAPSGKVYTLTNQHVCGLAKDGVLMIAEKKHSGRFIPRRIIEVYGENDLCLVEGLEGYEGINMADQYDDDDIAYASGHPYGGPLTFVTGLINNKAPVLIAMPEIPSPECTAKGQHVERANTPYGTFELCVQSRMALHTTLSTYPGCSGSAMVDVFGHVIGVIFASDNKTKAGYAVPLEDVKAFMAAY